MENAARGLLNAVAVREACISLAHLRSCGVIGEAMASTLAMELNNRMAHDRDDNGSRPIQVEATATPAALPEPEPEPAPKKRKRPGQLGGSRFCPICQEEGVQTRLSPGSVGCRAHWREVKRRQKAGKA